jgi:type I restriction enzyme S subunit
MSFPRYPTYKPSGVEWLGEVPEHWEVKRIASLYSEVVEAGNEDLPVLSVSIHHGVSDSKLSEEEMDRKVVRSEDRSKYKRVAPGDIVYNMMRAWQGAFGSVVVEGMVSPAYVVARPKTNLPTEWIEYLLRTEFAVNEIKRFSRGITDFRLRLYWDEFKNLRICAPPAQERASILRFLDHETAKIDALIAEQQRLIELLQEKRQAVISNAVTKGLNPDAPMKDSGVEWLGEVPEHWDVRKISQLFVGIGSGTTPKSDEIEYYEDGDIPWVVTGDLNDELLGSCSNFITRKAIQAHTTLRLYPKGSVAVAMYGATIGKAALFGLEATVNQACCVLPPSVKVNENFLLHFIISARNHLISLATGGGQPNINQDIVRSLRISIPEVDEQIEIVEHLSKILDELEGLLRLSDRQVLLLQERRSALISAAVTGQIDVRGLVPEAEAA